MSMPSPWTRLARATATVLSATVLSATVLSAAGAVALVPSTAFAADASGGPGAVVDLPGCTTNTLESGQASVSAALPSRLSAHGREFDSVLLRHGGVITAEAYGTPGFLNFFAMYTEDFFGQDYSPVTYGTTAWSGRPALCISWPDFHKLGSEPSADLQSVIVDRSDINPGDFDMILNYDRVHQAGTRGFTGYETYDGSAYASSLSPGSGRPGGLDDSNTDTGLVHGSRESTVLGRYVYRFRNGALVTAAKPGTTVEATTPTRSAVSSRSFTYAVADPTEEHLRFECRLLGAGATAGAFTTCADGGTTYDDLADGSWTFEVRAVDVFGGTDPTPASSTFVVDTTGPVTELDVTPAELSNDTTPTFTWSSVDLDVASFECNLDRVPSPEPSPWYACESGDEITALGDGDWRFEVRGIDDLDNEGEPVAHDFTVDTVGPVTELTGTPAALTNDNTPTFSWSSEDDASFECNLGRTSGEPSTWEECASGEAMTTLGDGDWTFRVRATDEAGNQGEPTPYDFTIDTEKSAVTVTGTPAALGNDATPTFTYAADPSADLDHFVCVVVPEGAQSASPEPCDAAGFTSEPLADGDYVFGVVAVDTAGNESDSALVRFTVDTTAPETSVTDGPTGVIGTGAATFGFASSETPATFECRITGAQAGAWQACAGGSKAFIGLTDGTWTFEVRATDAAGNTDATSASRTVVVNLAQPTITAALTSEHPVSEFGWHRSAVTITYTCAGNGSAVVSCPEPRLVPRAQRGGTFEATVRTADGDTATVSTTLFIDLGRPQAAIKGFSGKKAYTSMPKPRCKASDPRSGLDTCTVSVRKVEQKDGDVWVVVRARATDKAGNVRVVTKRAPFRAA